MKKIAVVGAGLIGIRHLRSIALSSKAQNVALVDITLEAKAIAKSYNIPFFQDIGSMISETQPDGIIIATPNNLAYKRGFRGYQCRYSRLDREAFGDGY